jgi:hypothetical protein
MPMIAAASSLSIKRSGMTVTGERLCGLDEFSSGGGVELMV